MRAARWRCALRCSYALPSAKAYDVTAVDGTRTNWHSPSRVDPTCRAGRWHRARSRTPLTRRCCGWWSARPLPWSARTPEPKSEGASPRSRERAGARSAAQAAEDARRARATRMVVRSLSSTKKTTEMRSTAPSLGQGRGYVAVSCTETG